MCTRVKPPTPATFLCWALWDLSPSLIQISCTMAIPLVVLISQLNGHILLGGKITTQINT